jgi:hypothetical protein
MVEAELRLTGCPACECSRRIQSVNMEQKARKKKHFLQLR